MRGARYAYWLGVDWAIHQLSLNESGSLVQNQKNEQQALLIMDLVLVCALI